MTFNSLHFIAFFAIVLAGFWMLRRHLLARNGFLLLASWYFYWRVTDGGEAPKFDGWHPFLKDVGLFFFHIRWVLLLLGTQLFDYTFARLIERYPIGSRQRKWCVVGSLIVNLTVLGFFKYCNFFLDNVVSASQYLGHPIARPMLNIALPAGISFYTFQSISYVIDVYRGHLKAEKHVVHYALFVALFPQLIAGPIERATHLLPQVKSEIHPKWDDVCQGTWLIWLGLFKKVVLADNVAHVANAVILQQPDVMPTWWESTISIYAFAIQIYCDFSAYSDIARGASRFMGFDLMRNFDLPYFAVNPSDFWRRWHISLSTWLRDYLYIPLGGNRGGTLFTYRNLFLTMLIGGLWHGATWLFILWGAYHGLLLCLHRALKPVLDRFFSFKSRPAVAVWTFVRIIVFFQFTCFGWLLFRAGDLPNFWRMVRPFYAYVPGKPLLSANLVATFVVIALVLLVGQLVKYLKDDHNAVFRMPVALRAVLYAGMILAFIVFGIFDGSEFIYFQF